MVDANASEEDIFVSEMEEAPITATLDNNDINMEGSDIVSSKVMPISATSTSSSNQSSPRESCVVKLIQQLADVTRVDIVSSLRSLYVGQELKNLEAEFSKDFVNAELVLPYLPSVLHRPIVLSFSNPDHETIWFENNLTSDEIKADPIFIKAIVNVDDSQHSHVVEAPHSTKHPWSLVSSFQTGEYVSKQVSHSLHDLGLGGIDNMRQKLKPFGFKKEDGLADLRVQFSPDIKHMFHCDFATYLFILLLGKTPTLSFLYKVALTFEAAIVRFAVSHNVSLRIYSEGLSSRGKRGNPSDKEATHSNSSDIVYRLLHSLLEGKEDKTADISVVFSLCEGEVSAVSGSKLANDTSDGTVVHTPVSVDTDLIVLLYGLVNVPYNKTSQANSNILLLQASSKSFFLAMLIRKQ